MKDYKDTKYLAKAAATVVDPTKIKSLEDQAPIQAQVSGCAYMPANNPKKLTYG